MVPHTGQLTVLEAAVAVKEVDVVAVVAVHIVFRHGGAVSYYEPVTL